MIIPHNLTFLDTSDHHNIINNITKTVQISELSVAQQQPSEDVTVSVAPCQDNEPR